MASYDDQLMDMVQTHNDSGTGNTVIVSPTQAQLEDRGFFDNSSGGGNRLITNLPEMRSQADIYIQPQPPVDQHTPQESVKKEAQKDFISAYEERLMQTTNFMDKQRIMNEFQDQAMRRLGAAQAATAKVVDQDMNLPAYRKKLQLMIAEDRKRGSNDDGMDSPNTAKMRDAVLKMEEQARKTTQEILKDNPDVKTFQTAVKTTLEQHSKLADKMLQDQEKLLAKKEAEQEAAQQVASFVSPEARQAIVNMNPAMKDDVAFAKFVVGGGGKDKNWKPILDGTLTPSDYASAAIQGNTAARGLAISEYAVRTGKSVLDGEKEMHIAESIAKSPSLALDAFAREGVLRPEEVKKIQTGLMAADSAGRKDIAASLQAKIPDLMQARTVNRVKADPTLVGQTLQSEEWNKAIAATAQKKGAAPTSFDVAMTYINAEGLSTQERVQRQEEVSNAYAATIAKEGSSGIFHPAFQKDQLANYSRTAKQQLTARTVSAPLRERLAGIFDVGNTNPRDYVLRNMTQ